MSNKKSPSRSIAAPPEFVARMLPCSHENCDMPPQSALLAHVCLLNSVLERAGDRQAAQHGLTMAQWFALGCVGHVGEEGVTHSELGQRLMLSKAPITGVVDRLERGGFVVREADAHDRRVSRVKITPKGAQTWEEVRLSLRELSSEICQDIGDEEILAVQGVLARLLENAARTDPTLAGEKVTVSS